MYRYICINNKFNIHKKINIYRYKDLARCTWAFVCPTSKHLTCKTFKATLRARQAHMLARLYTAKHLRLDLRWATQHRAKIHFLFRTTLAKSCRLSKLIPLRIHFETLGYDSLECIWRGLGLLQNDPLKNIRYRVFSSKKPFKRIRASKTEFLSKIDQNASKESRTNPNLPHAQPQQVLPR